MGRLDHVKLRVIGSSQGVIIPKFFLRQLDVGAFDFFHLTVEKNALVLTPIELNAPDQKCLPALEETSYYKCPDALCDIEKGLRKLKDRVQRIEDFLVLD